MWIKFFTDVKVTLKQIRHEMYKPYFLLINLSRKPDSPIIQPY